VILLTNTPWRAYSRVASVASYVFALGFLANTYHRSSLSGSSRSIAMRGIPIVMNPVFIEQLIVMAVRVNMMKAVLELDKELWFATTGEALDGEIDRELPLSTLVGETMYFSVIALWGSSPTATPAISAPTATGVGRQWKM
jgi:hypothetical protein